MSFKSQFNDILDSNEKVIDYNLSGSDEEPEVYFKINTGNGQHTDKFGDIYEYNRFYQFEGKVQGPEELKYRLNNKRPPE